MPNVENINKLIEVISHPDSAIHFDMTLVHGGINKDETVTLSSLLNTCGATACFLGFVCAIEETDETHTDTGAAFLGVDFSTANALFYPSIDPNKNEKMYDQVWGMSAAQAVKVLEHLRDTGEVDWNVIQEEV